MSLAVKRQWLCFFALLYSLWLVTIGVYWAVLSWVFCYVFLIFWLVLGNEFYEMEQQKRRESEAREEKDKGQLGNLAKHSCTSFGDFIFSLDQVQKSLLLLFYIYFLQWRFWSSWVLWFNATWRLELWTVDGFWSNFDGPTMVLDLIFKCYG